MTSKQNSSYFAQIISFKFVWNCEILGNEHSYQNLILVSPNTLESTLPLFWTSNGKKKVWVLKVPFLHIYTKKDLQQSCILRGKRCQCFWWIWVLSYVPYLPVYKSIPILEPKKKFFILFLEKLTFYLKIFFQVR